jgi:uncharacterized protein (UPF0262 family)
VDFKGTGSIQFRAGSLAAPRKRSPSEMRQSSPSPSGEVEDDTAQTRRIASIEIDEKSLAPAGPDADHERKVAIFDILEGNKFNLVGHDGGPQRCTVAGGQPLVFDVAEADGTAVRKLMLSSPRRAAIKDYPICDS